MLSALLGVILGEIVCFGAGVLIGLLLNEICAISYFDGSGGYFVVLIGLIGVRLGANAAAAILVRWARRHG